MSTRLWAAALFACVSLSVVSSPAQASAPAFDHRLWDEIVQAHVDDDGRVAYRRLRESDAARLDTYLEALARADAAAMPVRERLAFYINGYNATVLRSVLKGRTAESLVSRARFFRFDEHTIAGRSISLEDLENEIIRKEFGDPRIHFALVCASTSCPKLAKRAYTAENLDALLDERGRAFLADRSRNPLGQSDTLVVSAIFKWFAEDFEARAGSVQEFLATWLDQDAPACLAKRACRLSYADYDWSLNAQPNQRP